MNIKIALLFGMRSFLRSGKKNKSGSHLKGAVLGIALSLIPLLVVIVMANGMIEGITFRLIEVFTSHLQVTLLENPEAAAAVVEPLRALPEVLNVHLERSGYALVKSRRGNSATTVKAVSPELLADDDGFKRNFNLKAGEYNLDNLPDYISKSVFEQKILHRLGSEKKRELIAAAYSLNGELKGYKLKDTLPAREEELAEILAETKYTNMILGEALADKLEVGLGDEVFILSVMNLRHKTAVRSSKYLVTGIFSTGYQDLDKFILYIPYKRGMQTISADTSQDSIGIKIADPFGNLIPVKAAVRQVLEDNAISGSYIQSWFDKQRLQLQSFQSTKVSLIFIMCLITLVAAVNVYSSIHMLVTSKMREIAILKSMGATPGTITFSFLITGFATGVIGTLAGVILGLLLAVNINEVMFILEQIVNLVIGVITGMFSHLTSAESIKPFKILNPDYYLENIPIRISVLEVSAVAFFSILVATLTSSRPARIAGRIRPLEIIRKY